MDGTENLLSGRKNILIDQTGSTLYSAIASGRQAGKRLQTFPPPLSKRCVPHGMENASLARSTEEGRRQFFDDIKTSDAR